MQGDAKSERKSAVAEIKGAGMLMTARLVAAVAIFGTTLAPALAQKAYQDRPTNTYDQPIHVPGGPVPTVYVSYPFLFFDQGGLRTVIQNATNIADEGLKQCNKQWFDDAIKSLRYYISVLQEARQRVEQTIDVGRTRWELGGLDPASYQPYQPYLDEIQELTDDANTVASVINWLLLRQDWSHCKPPVEHAMAPMPPSNATAIAMAPPAATGTTLVALSAPFAFNDFYIGVAGGASFVPTVMATEFFSDGKDRFPWGSSIGSYFGAQAGLQSGNWRFEGQYTWSVNPAAATMPLAPDVKIGGNTETFGFFANGIYTPPFVLGIPVTPHIGVGVGALDVSTTVKVNDMRVYDSSNWAPGAQAIGGVAYTISPQLSLDLNYVYQTSLGDVDYKSLTGNNKVTAPYHSSYVTLGLNLHFPPPPPPPPPAGAIPQAHQFASLAPVGTEAAAAYRFTLRYDEANVALTPSSVKALHDALDAVEAGQDVRIAIAGCEAAADFADGSPCARHALRLRHLLARYGVENPGRLLAGG